MNDVPLGFIGAGNMAEAIARGILRAGLLRPDQMLAADPDPRRRALFAEELQVPVTDQNDAVLDAAPTLLVAVKPQQFDKALAPLGSRLGPAKLVLSICAGISTAHIEALAAPGTRVLRAMPNTPMLVGRGMVGLAAGRHATADDLAAAQRLLGAAAEVLQVPEDLLDAVTAVSGSGPAYFFLLAELLAQAAADLGLPEDQARRLALVTFDGAARLLAQSGEDPAALRRRVTSPGGTTEAALQALEAGGFGPLFRQAVRAARDRARQLGR